MEYKDPRGPVRTITAVRPAPEATYVTLDCGHIRPLNQIYSYRVGDAQRCFTCGETKES